MSEDALIEILSRTDCRVVWDELLNLPTNMERAQVHSITLGKGMDFRFYRAWETHLALHKWTVESFALECYRLGILVVCNDK